MLPQHPSFSDYVQAFYLLFKCTKKLIGAHIAHLAEHFHGKKGVG